MARVIAHVPDPRLQLLRYYGHSSNAARGKRRKGSAVALAGNEVTLEFAGNEEEVCELLAELIRRGHRLAEFRQPKSNLEDLFMSVTKGGVQ